MVDTSRSTRLLSVVMPCYRQERTVSENIIRTLQALSGLHRDYELIVVVDGKVDKTYRNAKKHASSNVKVVGYAKNKGKGYALRYGMVRSKGDVIAFIDGGKDLNPKGLRMLLAHFEWYNADIVVGSKWHRVSIVHYPLWRRIISIGYGLLVKLFFGLQIRDTQLGMKCYKRKVLEVVLPRLLVKKFAFDIELLAVANRLGFTRIYEAPVELDWDSIESSVSRNIIRSIWDTLWDTLAVYYRLNIVRFYDSGSKRKWEYDPDLDFRITTGELQK